MKVLHGRIRIRCYACDMPFEVNSAVALYDDHGTTPCPYCNTEQSMPYGYAEVAVNGRIDPQWEWRPDNQQTGSWFNRHIPRVHDAMHRNEAKGNGVWFFNGPPRIFKHDVCQTMDQEPSIANEYRKDCEEAEGDGQQEREEEPIPEEVPLVRLNSWEKNYIINRLALRQYELDEELNRIKSLIRTLDGEDTP